MKIYLDVLIIVNIYVNYFLLIACAKLTHTRLKTPRCILGAAVGSLTALVILLPPVGAALVTLIKLVCAAVIVFCAFGYGGFPRYIKLCGMFFLVNFIFAGIIYGFVILTKANNFFINNAGVYIDISLPVLIISTVAAYFSVCLVRRILDKKGFSSKKYTLIARANGITASLKAFPDSGNTLRDAFSGKPVIIITAEKAPLSEKMRAAVSNGNIEDYAVGGLRPIPCGCVTSRGIIPVIKPDDLIISDDSGTIHPIDALIGITSEKMDADAIFNPDICI